MNASANEIQTTTEAIVADFEALAQHSEAIATDFEALRAAAREFEQLLQESLAAVDVASAQAIQDATEGAEGAMAILEGVRHQIHDVATDGVAKAEELCRNTGSEIAQAADAGASEAGEAAESAEVSIEALVARVDEALRQLQESASRVDAKWVDGLAAASEFHVKARELAESFSSALREEGRSLEQGAETFSETFESQVLTPVAEVAEAFAKMLSAKSTELLDAGLDQLAQVANETVRQEVSALFDEAIEALKALISEKIDEIIKRRDSSEPERKALEIIFDALDTLGDEVKERIESVTDIKSAVGF